MYIGIIIWIFTLQCFGARYLELDLVMIDEFWIMGLSCLGLMHVNGYWYEEKKDNWIFGCFKWILDVKMVTGYQNGYGLWIIKMDLIFK